jgi:hypothetical protein
VANCAGTYLETLEEWRQLLSPTLAWEDDDLPATNLNVAHLRARYYSSVYMILRPCLQIAVHTTDFPSDSAEVSDQQSIIQMAAKCIKGAIKSTIAFDRVGAESDSPYEGFKCTRTQRLVVTNIFSTMHA